MKTARKGLYIRGHRGNGEVREALIQFARWLRKEFDFPVRVPVYLSPCEFVRTGDGRECSACFFAPFYRNVEPFIRIATGDYQQLKRQLGRGNALASFIISLAHEIVHYRQWIETGNAWEKGVSVTAKGILRRYEVELER